MDSNRFFVCVLLSLCAIIYVFSPRCQAWLRSFPIDESGTPSGRMTPGIYYFLAWVAVLLSVFVGLLAIAERIMVMMQGGE